MKYVRMPIEIESPESIGYDMIECNLAESSVRDISFREMGVNLDTLVMAYGDHIGKPALRELIADPYQHIHTRDVLLTVGAAGALFIIQSSLLTSNDHLIVIRPNYATNIETPKAIGCAITYIDLEFDKNYELDITEIEKSLRPNTKLVSITTPQNPTGVSIEEEKIIALCKLAEKNNFFLLVDETYRDLSFVDPSALAASVSDHAISVSSVSKAYGIPGIRLGWIITRNTSLQYLFLAAKEQIHICNSVVDEEICYQYLLKKENYFYSIRQMVKNNFTVLENWMGTHKYLEWVKPSGGVVAFPRFKNEINIDVEKFYDKLFQEYKTYVGPGHWFEQSKRHFRLGFGWERENIFKKGIENIDRAIES